MALLVTTSIPAEAWDEFTSSNPNASIFHTRQFISCFRNSPKYTPHTYFLTEKDETVATIIAVQTKILGDHLERFSSRSVVYGGILCSSTLSGRYMQRHITELVHTYDESMRKRSLFTEIRNLEDAMPLMLQMRAEKYRFVSHLNYLVDLKGDEKKIFSNISPTMRRKIRRAEKKGLQIEEVTSTDGVETLYSLVKDTYNRAHIPFFDIEVFQTVHRELSPANSVRMTLAKYHGRAMASRAALIYNGRIVDWFAGSTKEGYDLDAGAYLVWDMMRWGIQHGLSVFDFGGAGHPDETYKVRDFKSRFHGRLVNHGRFIKVYSRPRYHLGRAAYALVRRLAF